MSSKRVLLVEDEILLALDAADVLEEAGYVVIGPATCLDEALRLAEEPGLAGAVADINLGGTMVWPAAEKLVGRAVPLVLLSGFGSGLDVPPGLLAVPRLEKPVNPRRLLEALSRVMEAASSRA